MFLFKSYRGRTAIRPFFLKNKFYHFTSKRPSEIFIVSPPTNLGASFPLKVPEKYMLLLYQILILLLFLSFGRNRNAPIDCVFGLKSRPKAHCCTMEMIQFQIVFAPNHNWPHLWHINCTNKKRHGNCMSSINAFAPLQFLLDF